MEMCVNFLFESFDLSGNIENMCLVIHIVPFYSYIENMWIIRHIITNFEMWVYMENMCLVIDIVLFIVKNFKI